MLKITVAPVEKPKSIWKQGRRPPFLVVYKQNKNLIVLVSGSFDKSTFCGVSLFNGEYLTDWMKSQFEEYKGPITIENAKE